MEILLTNDDSHGSPLFDLAVERLGSLGNLTIVVPNEERSWTAKSMTRFPPLSVDEIRLDNHCPAFCVNGTPADCVNLAIYHLLETRPDLVVSGINVGANTGLAFVLSSGTLGACFEANIAGIPAIALSQDLDEEVFLRWIEGRGLQSKVIERLCGQSRELTSRVFEWLIESGELFNDPITWNVNLPFRAAADCRIKKSRLGRTCYRSCFKSTGDGFQHGLDVFEEDTVADADGVVVRQGHVSVTPIDIRGLGQIEG